MAYQGPREIKEFDEKIVQVNRVAKKTKGGNKIGFSVLMVIGDKKGRVGVGLGKSGDVQSAIRKGVNYAKKHLVNVPMRGRTIPSPIFVKLGAAKIILKPAPVGAGVIAGGAVRIICDLAGVANVTGKIRSKSSNQINNARATIGALKRLKQARKKIQKEQTADVK